MPMSGSLDLQTKVYGSKQTHFLVITMPLQVVIIDRSELHLYNQITSENLVKQFFHSDLKTLKEKHHLANNYYANITQGKQ